jgi:molybdopterin synthase catalytic subunit
MGIKICPEPFDPMQEVQAYQDANRDMTGKYGATSIFIGTMRDFNEGDVVEGMTLEHYPGMTEKQLGKIVAEAFQQWPVIGALAVHRVGKVLPNEPIVVVAVWTTHRGDAFEACRYIMEALKSRAPFWKKEVLASQTERWLEKNTDGYGR